MVGLQSWRSGFWNRKPIFFASALVRSDVVGTPSTSTRPAVGFRRPFMSFETVVFPAPFAPISATNSPRPTVKFRSRTAAAPP